MREATSLERSVSFEFRISSRKRQIINPKSQVRSTKWFDQPFDKPFDRLTVLSRVEGLTVLSKVEGLTVLSKVEGLTTLS